MKNRSRLLILLTVGALALGWTFAPTGAADELDQLLARIPAQTWREYSTLNNAEDRLPEHKDGDAALAAKLIQLEYVNRSRTGNGRSPVKLDILASRVANKMAAEAAREGFRGHWNTRGEKPYHRYAAAGGLDHVTENAAAVSRTSEYVPSPQTALELMRRSHDHFMAEVPPNDGHRQAVLGPAHTHVGLGYAFHGGEFRYYEEFLDRYLEFLGVQRSAARGQTVRLRVRPLSGHLTSVIVFRDPPLSPLNPAEINRRGSYSDFTQEQVTFIPPWDLKQDPADGSTTVELQFSQAGLYYVHMYVSERPYAGGRYSTEGSIQASGLVIRVD